MKVFGLIATAGALMSVVAVPAGGPQTGFGGKGAYGGAVDNISGKAYSAPAQFVYQPAPP